MTTELIPNRFIDMVTKRCYNWLLFGHYQSTSFLLFYQFGNTKQRGRAIVNWKRFAIQNEDKNVKNKKKQYEKNELKLYKNNRISSGTTDAHQPFNLLKNSLQVNELISDAVQ